MASDKSDRTFPLRKHTLDAVRPQLLGRIWRIWTLVAVLSLAACTQAAAPAPPAAGQPLIVSLRGGEFSQALIDAFTAETGVPVTVVTYNFPGGAEDRLRAALATDVSIVTNREIPALVTEGLLLPLDLRDLPNFKNISLNFRDLSFDPGNRYSIPFSWGAAGLVGRFDLLTRPPTHWADLWDPVYCGRIAVWIAHERQVIGAALKSLGYSANSENAVELAAARVRLQALKPCVKVISGSDVLKYVPAAIRGELLLGVGNAHEAYALRTLNLPFRYYLPEEGALLWGESFVISSYAQQPEAAAQFINFLLRPENGAALANLNYFQIANEAALPLIASRLREDPMLYPTPEMMRRAEILLPVSDAAAKLYDDIWQEFTAGPVE